jgi:hypothetical protein
MSESENSTDPSWRPFINFLAASVKDVHPTAPAVGGIWLTPARKVREAKEIAYQQRRFLDFGKRVLDRAPWISYLTCIKHNEIATSYDISAAKFPDIGDKMFWDELATDVHKTKTESKARLDEQTVEQVRHLCAYQVLADKILNGAKTIAVLRELRSKIQEDHPTFPWSILTFVSLVAMLIAIAVAAGREKKPGDALWYVVSITLSVIMFVTFFGISIYVGVQSGLSEGNRRGYEALFERDVAPCLRLANVDPRDGFNNLEYAGQVLDYLQKNYTYLKTKLLAGFV